MSNLSELSIQLRKLQATNTSQSAEIDRLNRQIKILSDLQGISLHDIKDALRTACEGEAHEELRAEVGRLKAQLECFQASGTNGGNVASKVKTKDEFDAEAASRARTNLELRVGELEELEGALRKELATVYEKAQQLTARNTNLETRHMQQQNVITEWEMRWKEREDDDIRKGSIVERPSTSLAGSYNYSEFANTSNVNDQPTLLLHNEPQSIHDTQQRLLAAEAALEGERQQTSLFKQQIDSAQKSYDLKVEQTQHRIQFLEGQIVDLEQQLKSLYTAFEFVQQERVEERDQKLWLKRNLLESDAALAQEAEEKERLSSGGCSGCPVPADSGSYSLPSYNISNPFGSPPPVEQPRYARATVAPPSQTASIAQGYLLLALPGHDSHHSKPKSPFSPRKLLSKSKSASHNPPPAPAPKFKRQYCVLHGSNGLYQLRYGNALNGHVMGVHEFITTGISSVEHTPRSSSRNYGFEIMINAKDADSPSLCCAAENEEDFMMWMTALTSVIDGSGSDVEHGDA